MKWSKIVDMLQQEIVKFESSKKQSTIDNKIIKLSSKRKPKLIKAQKTAKTSNVIFETL